MEFNMNVTPLMRTMSDDEIIQLVEHTTHNQMILELVNRLEKSNQKVEKYRLNETEELESLQSELDDAENELRDVNDQIEALENKIANMKTGNNEDE